MHHKFKMGSRLLLIFQAMNVKKDIGLKIVFVLLILTISLPSNAISSKTRDSILKLPLFKYEKILDLELKTDMYSLLEDIGEERNYHKCLFKSIGDDWTLPKEIEVKVKTRGNFRRRKQNCNFPPFRFKFPVKLLKGTEFEGQDRLKYVGHCQSSVDGFEQNTIKEYLVYKMYNLVSDHSYRVRLSRILFVDTITGDSLQKIGFFLEDRKDVAARNGKRNLLFKNIRQYNILRSNMVMLSLFQMMVGNTDWDVSRLHNIDLLSVDDNSIPVAVPFDFDWCSIVGHSYYTPDPRIDVNGKYKRRYKGYLWSNEEFKNAFSDFKELKESFFKLISENKYLNEESKQSMMNYILKFYELIDSSKDIEVEIVEKARIIPKIK